MQKKYIAWILALSILAISGGIFAFNKAQKNDLGPNTSEELNNETSETGSNNSVSDAQKKIDELRKRYAVKWIILEWENYLSNDLYALALRKFLEAAKENPSDPYIIKKIAESYFEMHKYMLAHKYYSSISDRLDQADKEKMLLSFIYQTNFSKTWSLDTVISTINELWLTNDESFYYLTSLSCLQDFHGCKKVFWDKLFTEEVKEESANTASWVTASWETLPPPEKNISQNLENIKKAIQNYINFQSEDISYKDALILGAYVQNKLYPIAIELGKKMLQEKPNYKPVLKIIAQSYFEMWNYTSAKTYLEKFIELDQTDKSGYYFMGVIQYYMREFILSNIFLKKAEDLGYEPKINIKRRMIYNYYELEQTEKVLSELRSLVFDQKEYTESDLYLAIYYHIINEKLDTALEIANYWLKKFPKNWEIYGYIGLIHREKWDIDTALTNMQKWLELNPQSPFILLNLGQIYVQKWENTKSIIYFKKAVKLDKGWEFWKQANIELEGLKSSTWSTQTGTLTK